MGTEISVYHLHYFVSKFLNLQRHVYNVSDLLVLCCSFSCCQCFEYMAQGMSIDGVSEASSVAYQIISAKREEETAQSVEELFDTETLKIDFDRPVKPACNSMGDYCDKQCCELSTKESQRELDGEKENVYISMLASLSEIPGQDDYPVVHIHRRASI